MAVSTASTASGLKTTETLLGIETEYLSSTIRVAHCLKTTETLLGIET